MNQENNNIVSNTINYTLNNDSIKLYQKINSANITLTDYQYFTARYFILNNYLKSLLAFYETGKGKTLLALYIMNNIFKIYDDWKIILLCKASLIETPWERSIERYYPELRDKIKIFSFEERNLTLKLTSFLNASSRTLIVIDELHIFISRSISKEYGDSRILYPVYKKIKDLIYKDYNNKILMLSATPIVNNAEEFIFIYNLLNPYFLNNSVNLIENENLYYIQELTKGLMGKISYIKSSEVASFENSEKTDRMVGKKTEFIYLYPTEYQKKIYIQVDKKENSMPSRGFRIKRNLACQFVYDGMEGNVTFVIDQWKPSTEEELKKKSIKFFECCQMILKSTGKVLVFETFIEYGINVFKKYLDFYKITYGTFTGEDPKQRYQDLTEFEKIENKDGDITKVFIISAAAKEGLSFTYITNMYILTSSWNEASLSQIIGRSIRLDSHKGSNIEYVYIYFMQMKMKELKTADEEIFDIMINKFKIFNKMYKIFKNASIENINETCQSSMMSIEEFKTLYTQKINEDNKITEKFKKDETVEVIYYSYNKTFKNIYLGYRKDNNIYDDEGVRIAKVVIPEVYKIVDKKLVLLVE